MFIRIKNTLTESTPLTHTVAQTAAGATALLVKNTNDFQVDYYVQVGQTNEERSEIVLVTTGIAGGTVPVLATRFPHPSDTPAFSIKYNQIVIKRSTTGTAGTAAAIGTISITPDHPYSQYEDTASQPGYAYKTCFRNGQLGVNSGDSAWITTEGFNPYSRGGIRHAVRRRIRNIPGIEDDDINLFVNEYMEMMRSAAVQVNDDYGLGTYNLPIGAGTQEYVIEDSAYKTPVRVWLIGSGTVAASPIFVSDIDPSDNYAQYVWNPRFYLPGDNAIGFVPPIQESGTAQIIYNALDSRLNSDDQLLPRPMWPYVTGFIDYATSMVYRQDGKDTLAETRERLAMDKIGLFKTEIDPRQRVQNQQIIPVEGTDFYNDFSDWGF